ncbi:MAG: hypothetical protein IMZ62_15910 [Chloroflexi bacterium]|nr:hypothetical protein [Chloroflexota bacterium]
MNEKNAAYLFGRYPILYQGRNLPITQNLMSFGFETNGDGWFKLIDQLSADITALDKANGSKTVATQVKEKYGGLRYYIESGSDAIYDLIDAAENASLGTCETCGEPGEQRGTSWISTMCAKCWAVIQSKEGA